ncbi:hypothetical protein [Streptomyces sp. JJ36]|uniref:hypothetical protein n=1 Tax=Streptomyces sp. JJ36 TaxID=2736645 RepID=UPI001F3DB510|nr:hypothetical protein [Streptomyces sp. JJ36]MCF6521953.1 hypothetical protein [Streptomyces sp. JJ36]
MSAEFPSVIAATAQWLLRAYPPAPGTVNAVLAQEQARQAATVAAWLRYPTRTDAALLGMAGPGGADRLDGLSGPGRSGDGTPSAGESAWRTWVDEVVASWAAALLADPALAVTAVAALAGSEHAGAVPVEFRRLTAPDGGDRAAAPFLRHPDLTGEVAALHRAELLARLDAGTVGTAG